MKLYGCQIIYWLKWTSVENYQHKRLPLPGIVSPLRKTKTIAYKTHSHGKLLITGEYLVLEGATGLAVPLKWGQSMKVTESQGAGLHWVTKDHKGNKWFEVKLNLIDFTIEKTSHEDRARYIQFLIKSAAKLNSDFLSKWKKYKVTCELGFDPEWGLGSSSTLITNLADWAELSPFELFFDTQEGSGYDVAAAMADEPLLYQKRADELSFQTFEWDQDLLNSIYVFYTGQKQNSLEEVIAWKANKNWNKKQVDRISAISEELADCQEVGEAVRLLEEHVRIMEDILQRKPFDDRFADFEGVIKPLGAWGGDFGLVLHEDEDYIQHYLKQQGIDEVFRLGDIVMKG